MGQRETGGAKAASRRARESPKTLSGLFERADRELRLAERDLRSEDAAVVAPALLALAHLRTLLRQLREDALRQAGH